MSEMTETPTLSTSSASPLKMICCSSSGTVKKRIQRGSGKGEWAMLLVWLVGCLFVCLFVSKREEENRVMC